MKSEFEKKLWWGALAFSPWIIFLTIVPTLLFGFHVAPGTIFGICLNLCILLVLVCYLLYVGRLKTVETEKKWLWRGLMVFGHVFSIPIFWYFYIWKGRNF